MKMYPLLFVLLISLSSHLNASPPPLTVTGHIQDETGKPLAGVSISLKGSSTGTTTSAEGSYTLTMPNETGTLVISYVGFVTEEVVVNGQKTVNVTLKADGKTLSDVVVVGYGTQRRENIIGSVAQVTSEDIVNRPVTQLKNALTGQMAGVTVTNANGRPGAGGGSIRVRGVGSFGATPDALIIIDGIAGGDFNNIDPNDVESISVLKDASSAAIYGARAANGVILVTTKSGNKSGKASVTYNGYLGTQKPTALPEYLESWEYALAFNEANGSALFTPAQIEKYKDGRDPDNFPNTNFIESILKKRANQTGHNFSINGGTAANQYTISLGTLYQGGIIAKNDFSRYNARINMRTVLSPMFEITTRLAVIKTNTDEPMAPVNTNQSGVFDIIDQAVRLPATHVGRLSNGDFGPGLNQGGTPISYIASPSFLDQNSTNLNGQLRLDFKPIKDLKFSFISSYVQENGNTATFRSTQRINAAIFLSPNNLTEAANQSNYYTLQGLAEYTKKIGRHQANLLLGYSFEENKSKNFSGFRDNLPGDELTVLNVGSPSNMQSTGTGSEWAIESQFARLNYSYANKYLVEGVVRRDASSRFAPTYKYAVFPSVAVGWRVGQEDFIKNSLPWVTELKLKASTGVLGNQNISNYPYQNTLEGLANVAANGFNGTNYSFGGAIAQGVARTTLVDSTIHWESTRTTDLGLELGINNNFTFSATYFERLTSDILYKPTASVSNSLGVNLSESNTGSLKNSGWEFTGGYNNHFGKVGFNVNANFSIINNKVLDLGVGNIRQPNGMVGNGSTLFVGHPLQLYYGFQSDGLFTDQEHIKGSVDQTKVNPVPRPGDIRYKDLSGPDGIPDGIVDATYDRVVLGSQIPRYTYGVNIGADYKGFDVSVLLQGVAGVKGNLFNAFGWAFYNSGNVQRWQYEERWTAENPNPDAKYPRLEIIPNNGTANSQSSSFWILNGSYLRVKNLQVGYAIPKTMLQKIRIANARFYVSGENLKTFSNYRQGWDPEINTGANFYPILSNFTFGLNLTF